MGYLIGYAIYDSLKWLWNHDDLMHVVYIAAVVMAIWFVLDYDLELNDGE